MSNISEMVKKAKVAMTEIEHFNQEQVDQMVYAVGKFAVDNIEELSELSLSETNMGTLEETMGTNRAFITAVWNHLSDKKSVGEIERDEEAGVMKIAHPGGVVADITPVTTPIIGAVNNGLLALKGRNAIIVGPPPSTKKTSVRTVEVMREALRKIGVPEDLVQVVENPSIESSGQLMAESDVVIGTGGPGIVKAAYSSGTPAYGVGPGNAQVILHEVEDMESFVEQIIGSRLVNYATACNTTQTLHYPEKMEAELKEAFTSEGAYWTDNEAEIEKIRKTIFTDKGGPNPEVTGKDIKVLADKAGINLPENTKIIITQTDQFGENEILSKEKPVPVMNVHPFKSFDQGLEIARENLNLAGEGHSSSIYTNDDDLIKKATEFLKVSRLLVNQPPSDSTYGSNNTMIPTVSQGCGFWGGNSTNELLDYTHLLNIQRVVFRRPRKPIPTDIWDNPVTPISK